MPKISVVIPVYGHAEYVLDSLDSVLAQSYDDFEVIVINDGSPDASESVLEPYIRSGKIRYVCQENRGVRLSLIKGLFWLHVRICAIKKHFKLRNLMPFKSLLCSMGLIYNSVKPWRSRLS